MTKMRTLVAGWALVAAFLPALSHGTPIWDSFCVPQNGTGCGPWVAQAPIIGLRSMGHMTYDAGSDLLTFAVSRDFAFGAAGNSVEGTFGLQTTVNETSTITDPGAVTLVADLGSGLETLFEGRVEALGFQHRNAAFDLLISMQVLIRTTFLHDGLEGLGSWVGLEYPVQLVQPNLALTQNFTCGDALHGTHGCDYFSSPVLIPLVTVPEAPAHLLLIAGIGGLVVRQLWRRRFRSKSTWSGDLRERPATLPG